MINTILKERKPPEQWQKGHIKRLYKGKGTKGKCSNERGITLASNMGKTYERVVNNRAVNKIEMTQAQAGGRKGRATVDHLLIIKELITKAKEKKQTTYIAFLDVTKAYDKAWLDAIMYVMYKSGLRDTLWQVIKKLNENLTAKLQTKYGLTRDIEIKDSIRQGGVLSVIQYALLIDEINKEIERCGLGGLEEGIGELIAYCLLWMDDVALIATKPENLQIMLDITNEIANRYHIEFGKDKTKILKIGNDKKMISFRIGEMEIEYTDKYKYLGEIMNRMNNLKDQIKEIKGKAEAAFQTLISITQNKYFQNIHMKVIWKLIEACIIPIITYAGETRNPNKNENKTINSILDNTIKRILMVPRTTPREAIYIETGIIDIEHTVMKNRVNMDKRLSNNQECIAQKVREKGATRGWKYVTQQIKERININNQDMEGSKDQVKNKVKEKIKEAFKNHIDRSGAEKSKIKHLMNTRSNQWEPGKPANYIIQLTRQQASIIFKARTRMLPVKNNYKGKYKQRTEKITCRACKMTEETQDHILNECHILHQDKSTKVSLEDLKTEETEQLKKTSQRIMNTMKKLEEINQENEKENPKTKKKPRNKTNIRQLTKNMPISKQKLRKNKKK